ncbi:hypothetical protein BH10PSE9_BH10PSE9_07340 [soil metagenome]
MYGRGLSMRTSTVSEQDAKRLVLEKVVHDLGRLQGQSRQVGETFIAFLIASAQREAGARYAELLDHPDPGGR